MEINYKQLNRIINEMNNQEITSSTNTVTTLSKKGQKAASATTDYILELETEIQRLKREHSDEISRLKEENKKLKSDNNELHKENSTLKKELEKAREDKTLYKDYIKDVEKELLRLPGTKEINKKNELVKQFIDWTLSVLDLMERIPLNKSRQFGYTARNSLINKLLTRQLGVFTDDIEQLSEHLQKNYTSNEREKGIKINSNTVKTLDDFFNIY